ncbi:hypothetical protein CERSUDRAFT_83183 [Gelatoporia subvermispora B]|uniref:HMA domain-containing protein n=1 Tax=Ceriporiopsis subvermispora (strain B) TaxID=914234 RepID=M2RG46_CERS8|nr:hypothetical protein CERSUDRAFT_83183 [Gelatoporia subvermispora B]
MQLARVICADDPTHKTDERHSCDDMVSLVSANEDTASTCCDKAANISSDTGGLRRRIAVQPGCDATQTKLPQEACEHHVSVARARHGSTLAAFGCICKAMLAHGLQSCCTTSRPAKKAASISSVPRLNRSTSSIASKKSARSTNTCTDGCCAKPSVTSLHYEASKKKAASSTSLTSSRCGDSCCAVPRVGASGIEEAVEVRARRPRAGGSCASVDSCCEDSCCRGSDHSDTQATPAADLATISHPDLSVLEKGNKPPDRHAVLAVKGMTCTGCENKLMRTMRGIPAISNAKANLVLCRAEFDYDGSATDLQSLVQTIEKLSGFTAEIINAQATRSLDLTIDRKICDDFLLRSPPKGVEGVSRMDKTTVRVTYDPRVVGARRILQEYAEFAPVLAPEARDPTIMAGAKHIRTLGMRVVVSSLLTVPVLIMAWAPLPPHPHGYAIASMVLATIVQTAITGPFYRSAFKDLFLSGHVEIDLLIVLSTTAAYVYSVVAFAYQMVDRPLSTGQFFETSTLLVTLIMLGQLVSAFARQRAMEAISTRSLQQQSAMLVYSDGREETIDARLLEFGDRFRVLPDSAIITDGAVVVGQSEVDESMITGEGIPVPKQPGSTVTAGTLNGSGTLLVSVTRLPGNNTISDIAALVDDARLSRARVQDTVDRVCALFVPTVLVASVATFLIWLAVGIRVRGQPSGEAAVTALTYAIALLAISCPCAIGLAVPMVVLVAGGVAARHGLVFKAASTIESARAITHAVFDKTGTLTQGHLEVVSSVFLDTAPIGLDVRRAIAGLVAPSRHPVSRAIASFLGPSDVADDSVEETKIVTGKGIEATLAGGTLQGGNPRWLRVEDHPAVVPVLSSGLTAFCVTYNGELLAVFGLEDTLRPEAASVVRELRKRGVSLSILSGDNAAAVDKVAQMLGIPRDHVRSGCLPADKQAYVKDLSAAGEKVLFCGDGTNDAVALAQADIGVHLRSGEGAGVAASTAADAVLLNPSLSGILTLLQLSDAVSRRIMVNFVWCAVYNLGAALFATGALVDVRIAPAFAGLGEVVSVLPVVLVAIQMRWFKVRV